MSKYGTWKGMPREEIPWRPSVDRAKCLGCKECFKFCSHKVYAWDDAANRPVVNEPFKCVVGCSNCRKLCKSGAITFPPADILQRYGR